MKIQAVQQHYNYINIRDKKTSVPSDFVRKDLGLQEHFYYPTNISFGLANSKGLKKLFDYGLPCMYTGVEMIDPQKIRHFVKNKTFNCCAETVFRVLKPFEESLINIEKEVYQLIKTQANHMPDKKIK